MYIPLADSDYIYPSGVQKFVKYAMKRYDAENRIQAACEAFEISRELFRHLVASASGDKLASHFDPELTERELADAVSAGAASQHLSQSDDRMEHVEIICVGEDGRLQVIYNRRFKAKADGFKLLTASMLL